MTVRGAAFLGIGAMVGAGIFALLGEAAAVAGSAVWLSFLLAGIVAALLGYTVVKLGVRYPSSGGLIAYLIAGLRKRPPGRDRRVARLLRGDRDRLLDGRGRVRELRDVALRRRRRRERLGQRLHDRSSSSRWPRSTSSARRVVDRAQSLIVIVAARRLRGLHRRDARRHRLRPARVQRLSAGLGHRRERRAHVLRVPRLQRDHVRRRRPAQSRRGSCRRRCTRALGVTTVLYVLISIGVFGTLTVAEAIGYGETAIAEAARPALGDAGFTMMAIAALLATASSVNATLYASGGLTAMLAEVGAVPAVLRPRLAARPARGPADHGRARARRRQPRRPLGDRVRRERLLADDLPARRCRGATGSERRPGRARRSCSLAHRRRPPSCSSSSPSTRCATLPRRSPRSSRSPLLAVVLDFVWKRVRGEPPATRSGIRRLGRAGVAAGLPRCWRFTDAAAEHVTGNTTTTTPAVPRDAGRGAERDRRDGRRRRDPSRGGRAVVRPARRPVQCVPDIRPAHARPGKAATIEPTARLSRHPASTRSRPSTSSRAMRSGAR